ncbi:HD domain-containing protein [Candidatus Bathyarchaeota archaeon]|nr:HD domain-containing protein [Candidatus Bathyarchaeota archaeon]
MVELNEELLKLINMINDEKLRILVLELFKNPSFKLPEGGFATTVFEDGLGSIGFHHSYKGGLLEHTVSCSKIGLAICQIVEEVYGSKVNSDWVLAATLIHDVYKIVVYDEKSPTGLSRLGEKIDHHTLVVSELIRRGFPLEVIHAVLAIHGQYGPITPKTVEALIAHLADQVDSTLCDRVLKAAKNLVKITIGEEPKTLTVKESLSIILVKQKGGWDALRELLPKT